MATRWNSHVVMLQSMIALRDPLDSLGDGHSDLTALSHTEWAILQELEETLLVRPAMFCLIDPYTHVFKPFLKLTARMENKTRPLLHEFIPALDLATIHLEKVVRTTTLYPVTRIAAARGLVVIDKYYSKTDESIMYRLAMSVFLSSSFSQFTSHYSIGFG